MADQALDTLVICGSLRKGSYNAALARQLPNWAPAGLALRPAPSFEKFPIYNFDIQNSTGFPADVNAWADAIRGADALIIVSPEYNWSIPGGLKNAIDWVSRLKEVPFKDKPVVLQSCSGGLLGGSRMQYHLRMALTTLGAIMFGTPEVFVNFSAQKFDEKTLELKDQATIDLIRQQLARFETFARKWTRKE
jgi:chromate reductase